MSVTLYDEALLGKLKTWTENTDIHVYGPDDTRGLFQVIADINNDKPLQLPLICLSRRGGYSIVNSNKRPMTYGGKITDATYEKSRQLNAIPISIPYQLDVYTRYLKEADAYIRDLVFNLINHPTLKIVIPYHGANILHNANIVLAQDIIDNSDIPERLVNGQFSRMSLMFEIDDAYLWDVRDRTNVHIGLEGINVDIRKDDVDYIIEPVST